MVVSAHHLRVIADMPQMDIPRVVVPDLGQEQHVNLYPVLQIRRLLTWIIAVRHARTHLLMDTVILNVMLDTVRAETIHSAHLLESEHLVGQDRSVVLQINAQVRVRVL